MFLGKGGVWVLNARVSSLAKSVRESFSTHIHTYTSGFYRVFFSFDFSVFVFFREGGKEEKK